MVLTERSAACGDENVQFFALIYACIQGSYFCILNFSREFYGRMIAICYLYKRIGTLLLNMYEKELPNGDRATFENAHQDSEYDSDEGEREPAEDQSEHSLDLNAINFLCHIEL